MFFLSIGKLRYRAPTTSMWQSTVVNMGGDVSVFRDLIALPN